MDLRRAGLVLGAALLATGWGVMQYADVQQRAVAADGNEAISLWNGERTKVSSWLEDDKHLSGKMLSMFGIIAMGAGATLGALALAGGRRYDAGP
jgi:hypothetical protein